MDVSQMSEEEQLRAAMELSLQDQGGHHSGSVPPQAAAPTGVRGGTAGVPLVGRTAPRAYPRKDPQDALPQCPCGPAKKRPRAGDPPTAGEQVAGTEVELTEAEVLDLQQLVFGGNRPEGASDVQRWLNTGFQFSQAQGTEWGLWQRLGGPCGILAPVQAYIVKQLLFGAVPTEGGTAPRMESPLALGSPVGQEDMRAAVLAHALTTILYQATATSSYVVCQVVPKTLDAEAASGTVPAAGSPAATRAAATAAEAIVTGAAGVRIIGQRVRRAADAQQLLEGAVDAWLAGPCGILSFVCTVVLSRTLALVREDMNDPSMPLIGGFGHCNQELVNLMLVGEAVPHVFDGTQWLGDDPSSGFLVKGIDGDRLGVPIVGFLSELEPMRYLQVGNLYKYPDFPLWVYGSQTHYTLLFSARRSDAQLSREAEFEQRAKKVFNSNALDAGSLAMASSLQAMLDGLGIGADRLAQARGDLVHEDVILWDDFRSWACNQCGIQENSTTGGASSSTIKLFLYDGQDPPGPSLKAIHLELTDIDPRLAGGSDGDVFSATLHTRWPNAMVQVSPLAGAGAEGLSGTTVNTTSL